LKRFIPVFIILLIIALSSSGFAQLKVGYVDSQKILAQYQEAIDAQNQLEQIRNQYQAEYEMKVQEYQALAQEIESQSLLLSEEKKKEKLRELQTKATEIDQ
jgi:outer membrane protein